MNSTDTNIIARFLIAVAESRADTASNVDKVIQRFGRPYVSQLTANGHDLAQATAMLRQAYLAH